MKIYYENCLFYLISDVIYAQEFLKYCLLQCFKYFISNCSYFIKIIFYLIVGQSLSEILDVCKFHYLSFNYSESDDLPPFLKKLPHAKYNRYLKGNKYIYKSRYTQITNRICVTSILN